MPKKIFSENLSKKYEKLFDEAEKGDIKSIIEILVKSGRFQCSESDLKEFMKND